MQLTRSRAWHPLTLAGLAACSITGPTASTASSSQTSQSEAESSAGPDSTVPSESTGADTDELWATFLDGREAALVALGEPILACVVRQDTAHAAFHGCYDWHSAVHATYALHALHRVTGDSNYLAIADETLDADAIAGELAAVTSQSLPAVEIPYGYAWFLLLAQERERAGRDDLRPLADEVAAQLVTWLDTRTPAQLDAGIVANDYGSIPWAVDNLHRWGVFTGNDALVESMNEFTTGTIADPKYDEACPVSATPRNTQNFFPPCLHRAMVLSRLLPPDARASWLETNAPADLALAPFTSIDAAHQAGLNFSRPWGLWALYRATNDTAWRTLYAEHVITHVGLPQYWNENYDWFSHWVAQFGVYAILRSYDDVD